MVRDEAFKVYDRRNPRGFTLRRMLATVSLLLWLASSWSCSPIAPSKDKNFTRNRRPPPVDSLTFPSDKEVSPPSFGEFQSQDQGQGKGADCDPLSTDECTIKKPVEKIHVIIFQLQPMEFEAYGNLLNDLKSKVGSYQVFNFSNESGNKNSEFELEFSVNNILEVSKITVYLKGVAGDVSSDQGTTSLESTPSPPAPALAAAANSKLDWQLNLRPNSSGVFFIKMKTQDILEHGISELLVRWWY